MSQPLLVLPRGMVLVESITAGSDMKCSFMHCELGLAHVLRVFRLSESIMSCVGPRLEKNCNEWCTPSLREQ
eukprot:1719518-Amphidinium_carterae.1